MISSLGFSQRAVGFKRMGSLGIEIYHFLCIGLPHVIESTASGFFFLSNFSSHVSWD